jgi:phage/plasmid-like protein (TIGR03299 family)
LGRPVNAYGTFRWNDADRATRDTSKAEFLGVVGEDYKVIQHATGFEMVDALMNTANGAHYESAGVLGKGEIVWGLADLGLTVSVGADKQNGYLLFCTSHDGSYSYLFRTCLTRVVCQNTLNAALSEKTRSMFRVRHTKNAMTRIAGAHDALQAFAGDLKTIEQKLNLLAGKRMTRASLVTVLDRLFPKTSKEQDGATVEVSSTRRDNILVSVLERFEHNDGNAFPEFRGTAYNLLNAITEYTDHLRGVPHTRAQSALFGSGDKLKTDALRAILDESGKLPSVPTRSTSVAVMEAQDTTPDPNADAEIRELYRLFGNEAA